ncbi:hypothetical protein [Couchioplanes caeruleus]|uniref:hypothetical protein n=1 Tax=Couchioplanes caeruleus TaxID=56438 RepID=UPI00200FDC20|nr:hypothetical protein [Couchioplanes caeruleus]
MHDLIAAGEAEPSFIVSHELPLDRAPEACQNFDKRDDGWTKVVLHPAIEVRFRRAADGKSTELAARLRDRRPSGAALSRLNDPTGPSGRVTELAPIGPADPRVVTGVWRWSGVGRGRGRQRA